MADEEYNRKLESLQQYIPFLNNMIAQLKDPRKKNREQQLAKMVSLHSMITDKKKKLKLETLTKCEDVILKLYEKVKSGSSGPSMSRPPPTIPSTPRSPITPSSPSPPRDIPRTKPVVIPTEKVPDRSDRDNKVSQPSSYKNHVDIYSSAADSLKIPSQQKSNVFERLGKRGPDMSKPPISLEDLEALQQEVLTERLSLNELTDLREKLQKQLSTSEESEQARKSPINTTVRNTTILTKKAVEKAALDSKVKVENKPVSRTSAIPTKPVKVIKEASSIFGSTLSSIDNQIMEGVGKNKEKERRNSVGSKKESDSEKTKERRSSKDEKKDSSSHMSFKEKTEKKSTEHKSKDEKKDRKEHKKDDSKTLDSIKKDQEKKKSDSPKDEPNPEEMKIEPEEKPKPEEPKPSEPPVYKRLADKYNPRPRKPSIAETTPPDIKKPIDSGEKLHPIPFLEISPTKTPPPPIAIPLLSPTSSTSTVDNEVASFNRKSLLPTPPPVLSSTPIPPVLGANTNHIQPIPSHVSNILTNPNTSALVNNVVNQFKGRQTPVPPPTHGPPPFQHYQQNDMRFNQPGYWHNQAQGHHQPRPQHFPPRPFLPVANQFDQMQNMDYYPPGSTPTHNPYSNQAPPLLSPHYDGYERKFDEGFNKDRDMRYRDDWRRPPSSCGREPQRPREQHRESNRDPRLHRESRDPRNYREDPRTTPRRDSRESERDGRSTFRDPRLNRYKYERERDQPNRQRSRSVSRDSEENTFTSPLDSLYSGNEGRRTGKGYGVQNFKIPKIKKEGETESEKESETDTSREEKVDSVKEDKDTKEKEKENEENVKEEMKKTEVKESDESVASTSVSSSTECEEKKEDHKELSKDTADVGEISSTNDIQETRDEPKPLDDESQTDIINKFLKKLLENERTRAAASLFIDNVSNSLDDEKLKMVVQTVKSATKEEEQQEKKTLIRRKKVMKMKFNAKLAAKKKQAVRRRLALKKRKAVRVIKDDDEDEEVEKEENKEEEKEENEDKEDVVVSVGERIKSRKRVASSETPKRKKNKHKTELDLLHEDIQDMFIRDGVLTATGKRMCRLLKNDEVKPPPVETKRRTRNNAEKFDTKVNCDKLKAMSNVRVLIPKISMDKLEEIDDDSQRYSLRRSNKSGKNYAEPESDEEKDTKKEKEEEEEEEAPEEKKKEESDFDAEETLEEKERSTSPKKVRKRSKSWASGIIPKRKKKTTEEKEPEEAKEQEQINKSLEFAEPDKNYYSSKLWHSKTSCKLCDYNGMNITRHYRTQHPDSEVLSSRLSPEKAEKAIKKSLEFKLTEKENENLCSTKRYQFCCRFCDLEMRAQPSNFYDHISTHTGEYRHICSMCDFSTCGGKPLKLHYVKAHNVERFEKAAWVKTKIYGYICVECNFIQMDKKTVENHVNVYHLKEGIQILKVHLSVNDDDAPKEEEQNQEEVEDNVEEKEEPKPKRKKLNEKGEPKKPTAKVPKAVSPKASKAASPKVVKASPKKSPLLKPVKKEKEIDMTVFTCNTNIQEENQKIEEERLRKMTELNESVKTNRQSLNFVDQLSNRLLQEQTLESEIVTVKSEPLDDFYPETETVVQPDPLPEITPRKPTKVMEPPVSSLPVVQKDNTIIQGMIQKLQGILKEEQTFEGPPPLAPLLEKNDDGKAFISAGFLNISKTNNGLEYACRVPSCLFTSTNRDSFVLHWEEDHTRINQSYKATKCRICQQEVTATPNAHLLSNFFAHVENEHLCGIKTSFNAGYIGVDKDRDGLTYMCCVQLCLFNTTNRESFVAHLTEHPTVNSCKSTKCGICQEVVAAASDSNLLHTLFLHVETEHLEEDKSHNRKVLRTRRLSGDKLSTTKNESPELAEEEEDNPFPFKISGVMSLAEETVPPLSPIQPQSPKIESVVLKEAKMNTMEKAAVWKCADAMKKFLQCTRELYKCPQFFCKYATSWRHLFESHIKAHARANDEQVSCVYCDVKTPLSHAGLHIDLRHSNCLYSCSQCLYRALTREYVMIHNRMKHKENDVIVALPQKTAKTIMMSKPKQFTVKDACQPYRCSCDAEFLFLSEFCTHLQNCQDKLMSCGFVNNNQRCNFQCMVAENMIDHWRSHGCYNFHCLVCKMGCMEMYSMLEHYSCTHPSMEPIVVDRRKAPLTYGGRLIPYGYTEDAFSSIRYIKEELLESVNVQQYAILAGDKPFVPDVSKTETTKNVTLVPLSILQPNSTETKKIIAIIPNKVDNITSKLFAKEASPFVFASTSEDTKEKVETKEESLVVEEAENSTDNSGDPLSLDGEVGTVVSASGDESDSQELIDNVDMKSFGFIGYQLYRCAFCDISFSNTRDFKAHTMHSKQCRDPKNTVKPYKCVHCERLFKNPHGLLEHIQYHGPLRFGCSLCVKKFPSSFSLKLHMRSKHSVTNTITTPLIPNKTNLERDEFVLRPVQTLEPEISKEGPSVQNVQGHKSVYGPDEIDELPKRYIFNSNVKCALCSYSTKVRTNLVRHLQFHSAEKSVPDIAPVNPVPCLDKNERMFDKMTNLAISSMSTSRMGGIKTETKVVKEEHPLVPAYVPAHRRYVCCAEGCNYLCLEEANLRHHVYALHVQEPAFSCSHCKMTLKTDVEGFLKHLKLHDLHLYKCSGCSFVHNLRHKVDKHASDKHPEKAAKTITIRSMDAEIIDVDQSAGPVATGSVVAEPPPPSNIKWTKPWHCGMCKYRCAAKSDIIAHIFNKHDINAQFKCTLCSYKTDEKSTFERHFKENHPDNEIDIIHVYYKSEGAGHGNAHQKQFDTTPLWQRDRPRVRHIRGILFEETSPQKGKKCVVVKSSTPTSTVVTPPTASNLDLAIDAVAKGIDEATKCAKETKDETVIVIDHEEEEESQKLNESGDNHLLIDIDAGAEPSVKEEKEKGEFLSEEILTNKYGKLCGPGAKGFKCPVCLKFKNKKVSSFIHHVLTELECFRCKCTACDFACVTYDAFASHCREKHDSVLTPNLNETPIESSVVYWLQLLISHQSKELIKVTYTANGEEFVSSTSKSQCDYCQKWFKNLHLLKDHELFHWANNTYTCSHCCTELQSLNELFQHNLLSHPMFDVEFTTDGPYVGRIIETLKTPQISTSVQSGATTSEDTHYSCSHCSEVERSVEALRKHSNDCHKGEEFAYKVVTKSKIEAIYCCTYCHERGTDKFLKEHQEEKHPGMKFDIYQYICLECSGTYLNIKDLRAHFNKAHSGKKLSYSCIESKLGGSRDQFCCTKCPFRSTTLGGIRSHLRKHLRPIDCLICGATFIYPTEARAHHNKEHIQCAEKVEENKDKLNQYEELVRQIIAARGKGVKGVGPSPGPSQPPRKMLARKSTGAPFVREYSFYGTKKEESDLKTVSTSIEVNKVTTKMSAEQFSNIFNIFPVVEVKDCEKKDEGS